MAKGNDIAASKAPRTWTTKQWELFEKWGRPLLWSLTILSLAYLFVGEPYLYSVWRRAESVGVVRVKSEIERRDKWGRFSDGENEIEIFVGDRVDADFKAGGTFVDQAGREQTLSYPFRVQQSSQHEILFSPLSRRNGNVTWVQRKPQQLVPQWKEILATWRRLKTDWAEFKTKYPPRKTVPLRGRASLAKRTAGKGGGRNKAKQMSAPPGVGLAPVFRKSSN